MSDRVCKNCCEYDSPKGFATGYCVMAKTLTGCGVVPADGSCCRFAAGKFSDRLKIRAARNGTEEWLEKCLSCTRCYKKKQTTKPCIVGAIKESAIIRRYDNGKRGTRKRPG